MPSFSWPLASDPVVSTDSTTEESYSAIQKAKRAMLTAFAEGEYLNRLGQNYGVVRYELLSDDEMYRQLIILLAYQPKTILFTVYKVLEIVFGSQEEIIAADGRPWRVYEVKNNEFVVEIPVGLLTQGNETASYLHGYDGHVLELSDDVQVFVPGDAADSVAPGGLIGLELTVLDTATGLYMTPREIIADSYDDVDDNTSLEVDPPLDSVPTTGAHCFISVPGDLTSSQRGDYLPTGGFASIFSTAVGPDTDTLTVRGDVSQHVAIGQTVSLVYEGATEERVVDTVIYDATTNTTEIVLTTADVPGGLEDESISLAQEQADTLTTPDHDDRVYLAGDGLLEVAKFYLNTLVRAAGVSLRVEQI
jgi:hypothetical protein